jgi:hypothetical protein
MKKPFNPVLPSPPEKEGEVKLKIDPCCECRKPITDGYYGRYGDGGVCSKACDILHMKKKRGDL